METFRTYLQQEFVRRSQRNENYSLRAYSRQLGVHPGTLSSLLSGARPVSPATVAKLGARLGFGPRELNRFLGQASSKPEPFPALAEDLFSSISEWYFDAILELSRVPRVRLSPAVIASALGIGEVKAKIALETLIRLGLLVPEKGRHRATQPDSAITLDADLSTTARKNYQKSLLEKSITAVDEVSRQQRDHSSTTIAMSRKDLPATRALIQEFRRELNDFLQRDPKSFDDVYQLQVSFFPLTTLHERKS